MQHRARLDGVEVGEELLELERASGQQRIEHRLGFLRVRPPAQRVDRQRDEPPNEKPPARIQRRLEKQRDEPPGLKHRKDRRGDLEVSVSHRAHEVSDDRLPLVAVEPLEAAGRDEDRRVVGGEANRHRVDGRRVDDPHLGRANPGRDGDLLDDVRDLLLGQDRTVRDTRAKTAQDRPRAGAPREQRDERPRHEHGDRTGCGVEQGDHPPRHVGGTAAQLCPCVRQDERDIVQQLPLHRWEGREQLHDVSGHERDAEQER